MQNELKAKYQDVHEATLPNVPTSSLFNNTQNNNINNNNNESNNNNNETKVILLFLFIFHYFKYLFNFISLEGCKICTNWLIFVISN